MMFMVRLFPTSQVFEKKVPIIAKFVSSRDSEQILIVF